MKTLKKKKYLQILFASAYWSHTAGPFSTTLLVMENSLAASIPILVPCQNSVGADLFCIGGAELCY